MVRKLLIALVCMAAAVSVWYKPAVGQDTPGVCPDTHPVENFRPAAQPIPPNLSPDGFQVAAKLGADDEHPNTVLICSKLVANLEDYMPTTKSSIASTAEFNPGHVVDQSEPGDNYATGVLSIGIAAVIAVIIGIAVFVRLNPRDSNYN